MKHYSDQGYLLLTPVNALNSSTGLRSRITDFSYLIDDSNGSLILYNLDQQSKCFNKVYVDKEVNKILRAPTVLVSERVQSDLGNLEDTIIYGINPETFEVKTPIWSEMQQRYIPVYTKKQAIELLNILQEQGKCLYLKNLDDLLETTIDCEVTRYLTEMQEYFDKPLEMDDEEFIKKFKGKL